MGDEEMRDRAINLKIGEKVDSDHQLVVIRIERDKKRRGNERRGNRERREIWNKEGREVYKNKMMGIGLEEEEARIEREKWKGEQENDRGGRERDRKEEEGGGMKNVEIRRRE